MSNIALMNKIAQPGPNDNVLTLCHMLSNRISRAFLREVEKFGITVAEWRVILTLAQHKKASGQDIASRWAMDKMTISRAISSLEDQGLIIRQKNSKDKRSFDLTLSKAGQALYKKILPVANKRYYNLITSLDKSEMKTFRRFLITMIEQANRETE